MFGKVLIANRGVIACRIIRTLRRMGVRSVAVYSEADRHSLHVRQADEAVAIGPSPPAQSYLAIPALIEAARATHAEAIHPGYGFLSENAGFAEACERAGIAFIGPAPEQMRLFGLKHTARRIAKEQGVPLLPGTGLLETVAEALAAAESIGYPVMLKSTAGGGGIGMRLCDSADALNDAFAAVRRLSEASFGSAGLYLEKFVRRARHIEVQIFGDGAGGVIALGERDCSAQRRNQKVIEETPAPGISGELRAAFFDAAVLMGKAVRYRSAGTVEFLLDADSEEFYFLEVNTRLQVEHGVTEEVTCIDLVEWMVRNAAGDLPDLDSLHVAPEGASIQVRIYAEDPGKQFQPAAGRITFARFPESARVETWVEPGADVTPFYDPMLAKIIAHGSSRGEALARLRQALGETHIAGIETNIAYLSQIAASPAFVEGGIATSFLGRFDCQRGAIDVLAPGTQTTIQDYPGRIGYWHVGVPPSGPMDSLSFRIANRLVGNPEGAPALEITVTGPTLHFRSPAVIALTGADFQAQLDGAPIPYGRAIFLPEGATVEILAASGPGARAYLAIAGGFESPEYLGSASTFILGGFGGPFGRTLRAGDVLSGAPISGAGLPACAEALGSPKPPLQTEWEIGALYGPHGAPDFFTQSGIDAFFAATWKVHHNSDRTGVRLIGPKPEWARKDGGEAGLHPSNIHDNAYAVGSIDFTGDMPVILGPDGPSLGGFVCPAVVVSAEVWKIGQLRPGNTIRFRAVSLAEALRMEAQLNSAIATLSGDLPKLPEVDRREPPILRRTPWLTCRADGDRYLLIEYGANVLDLNLRLRVHALETELRALGLRGILDVTPGVRSLQIHYDAAILSRAALLEALDHCETRIPPLNDIEVPSRLVRLPLSWDDPATQLAIRKYMQSVRPDAPWCPSNIEFIRRINGLASEEDVRRIVFEANYLVLGLGDVYLGAPVATPIDPRHRLVTTKYNPARTWTPENAVGIGGAYLCVYGMEGPGGYQFVGRTVQMWNTWRATREFESGAPWLLRFFDQIQFYPVSAEELLDIRESFPYGGYPLRIEPGKFRLHEYRAFLDSIEDEAADFKRRQQAAFDAERERWAATSSDSPRDATPDEPVVPPAADAVPEGCHPILSPVTASVWNIPVQSGERVEAGQKLVILEAMKMEIAVAAPRAGTVERLVCAPGALVTAGQHLVILRQESAR
jgi:urea carboxylase